MFETKKKRIALVGAVAARAIISGGITECYRGQG